MVAGGSWDFMGRKKAGGAELVRRPTPASALTAQAEPRGGKGLPGRRPGAQEQARGAVRLDSPGAVLAQVPSLQGVGPSLLGGAGSRKTKRWGAGEKKGWDWCFSQSDSRASLISRLSCGFWTLTVYLGKRDFVDHLDRVDPVDGVVLVDPEYLKDRKVFVTLTCAFRYGREDLDVLGLSFRKDLFLASWQAFPPAESTPEPLTRLQERLLRKLGANAHPFSFLIPQNLPCSVTLQPGPEDTGKACGVDFEIRAFCAKNLDEKIHKRNSVRLVIRKVQYAPEKPGPQPTAETTRHFLMSDRSLHLEASLDKELYYHGEPISVNVHVTNNSSKSVKKVKVAVRQYADICLFSTAQYKCPVAQIEQEDQVAPSSTFCKVYTLTPLLSNNREKRGLALDGKLKHEDTNLASSTIVTEGTSKEVLGVLVSYRVKVKLVVSRGGDVAVELPFVLMHPKPPEQPSPTQPPAAVPESDTPVYANLIEFETNYGQDEDMVFEDFARLRLKGLKDDEDTDHFC
ncbi:beta-arrestin-2 [Python bivittatus]|uniref:Beta-arrestin-2 n=1 Tax=Python bivittatus TaxID=176946 RepID=A0A9F5N7F2_PYTBI|nr:beta-arrestin-2 [Python bivittatus]